MFKVNLNSQFQHQIAARRRIEIEPLLKTNYNKQVANWGKISSHSSRNFDLFLTRRRWRWMRRIRGRAAVGNWRRRRIR